MNTKTAEEIIKPKIFKSYGLLVVHIDDVEDCMEEYASHLKKRIEELEAWIDCKERMPEPETVVLVSKLYGGGSRQTLMSFTTKKFPDLFDCFSGDKITHWKPVPEFKL